MRPKYTKRERLENVRKGLSQRNSEIERHVESEGLLHVAHGLHRVRNERRRLQAPFIRHDESRYI
jgi:hypothetical protein